MLIYWFCPPSRRRFDRDGALMARKGATDAIAATIRVDDSNLDIAPRRSDPCKNGGVIVTITRLEATP